MMAQSAHSADRHPADDGEGARVPIPAQLRERAYFSARQDSRAYLAALAAILRSLPPAREAQP